MSLVETVRAAAIPKTEFRSRSQGTNHDQDAENIELQATATNESEPSPSSESTDAVDLQTQLLPVTKKRQSWVLISAFLTVVLTVGLCQAYGALQVAYTSPDVTILTAQDSENTALVAFVGTLAAGLTWAGSVFVNPWMTRVKDVRWITTLGVVCMSLGLFIASFVTRVYQLLLTQGLLFGIGSSMLYYPTLATAPEYFNTHRGLAMGIIFSGAGIGAVVFSPLIQGLTSSIGIRWTLRVLALLNLAVSTPIALFAIGSRFSGRRPSHISWEIAKKPTFLFTAAAALMLSAGNLIPLTFLSEYSIALGYSAAFGAALISIANGVNAVSRILIGFVGDKVGRQNALSVTIFGSAFAVIALWFSSVKLASRGIWLAFVLVYGVWAGGYSALYPTTVADVFGLQAYASVNGFIYLVRGLGSMFGSPVAGALLASKRISSNETTEYMRTDAYSNVVYFNAALMFGASICVVCVRYFDAREHGGFKLKA